MDCNVNTLLLLLTPEITILIGRFPVCN